MFKLQQIVWAKIGNDPAWPAKIVQNERIDKQGKTSYLVSFYAQKSKAYITLDNLFDYVGHRNTFLKLKGSRKRQEAIQIAQKLCKVQIVASEISEEKTDKLSLKQLQQSESTDKPKRLQAQGRPQVQILNHKQKESKRKTAYGSRPARRQSSKKETTKQIQTRKVDTDQFANNDVYFQQKEAQKDTQNKDKPNQNLSRTSQEHVPKANDKQQKLKQTVQVVDTFENLNNMNHLIMLQLCLDSLIIFVLKNIKTPEFYSRIKQRIKNMVKLHNNGKGMSPQIYTKSKIGNLIYYLAELLEQYGKDFNQEIELLNDQKKIIQRIITQRIESTNFYKCIYNKQFQTFVSQNTNLSKNICVKELAQYVFLLTNWPENYIKKIQLIFQLIVSLQGCSLWDLFRNLQSFVDVNIRMMQNEQFNSMEANAQTFIKHLESEFGL